MAPVLLKEKYGIISPVVGSFDPYQAQIVPLSAAANHVTVVSVAGILSIDPSVYDLGSHFASVPLPFPETLQIVINTPSILIISAPTHTFVPVRVKVSKTAAFEVSMTATSFFPPFLIQSVPFLGSERSAVL